MKKISGQLPAKRHCMHMDGAGMTALPVGIRSSFLAGRGHAACTGGDAGPFDMDLLDLDWPNGMECQVPTLITIGLCCCCCRSAALLLVMEEQLKSLLRL